MFHKDDLHLNTCKSIEFCRINLLAQFEKNVYNPFVYHTIKSNVDTTRKTIIGRNTICGAPKGACSTKLFLWRMKLHAPHKFWRLCGAYTGGAPHKLAFLWRMCKDAP
jgi:hypothetical protein